jgi:hypothetical protein
MAAEERRTWAPRTDRKTAGVASRRLLTEGQGLSSAALLTAALLAAATLLAATASLASATLLLALALLAFTFLFVTIALLPATALLAALLPGSRRFDRFVRITLCFHSIFLYSSY